MTFTGWKEQLSHSCSIREVGLDLTSLACCFSVLLINNPLWFFGMVLATVFSNRTIYILPIYILPIYILSLLDSCAQRHLLFLVSSLKPTRKGDHTALGLIWVTLALWCFALQGLILKWNLVFSWLVELVSEGFKTKHPLMKYPKIFDRS